VAGLPGLILVLTPGNFNPHRGRNSRRDVKLLVRHVRGALAAAVSGCGKSGEPAAKLKLPRPAPGHQSIPKPEPAVRRGRRMSSEFHHQALNCIRKSDKSYS